MNDYRPKVNPIFELDKVLHSLYQLRDNSTLSKEDATQVNWLFNEAASLKKKLLNNK